MMISCLPFPIRIRSASRCIPVSEEDEEATFVDPPLRGRCVAAFDLPSLNDLPPTSIGGVSIGTCVICFALIAVSYQNLYLVQLLPGIILFLYQRKGKAYSVNEGNVKNWDGPTAKHVENCKFPKDGSSPKSLRYIGSMVADEHHTLFYGGIVLYPADKKSPNGKLRVLYEVFPMSGTSRWSSFYRKAKGS
ncbi:unnamed protein product [Musa hybrid cultivar]